MLKKLSIVALIAVLGVLGVMSATAQTATPIVPAPENPNAVISFPPPVYVLAGDAEIQGTANLTGQTNYFIEYRPLEDDFTPMGGEQAPWFPATLPTRGTVVDGLLGEWDTTVAPDGLYAIRLTINQPNSAPVFDVVTPIRVDNAESEELVLDVDEDINQALLSLTATAAAFSGGSGTVATPPAGSGSQLVPTPTAFGEGTLTAEVLVLSNLRQGDSTLYPVVRGLQTGTQLTVLGRSSRGTNWLFVRTPGGDEGWVAPSVVQLSGSIIGAPEVQPPPVPFTPTPTPTNTPEVPDLPDARIVRIEVDRDLEEGEPFQILVTARNDGTEYFPETILFCNVEPMDAEVAITAGDLQEGQERTFALPLRIDEGGGQDVNIICRIDMNDQVAEINENNNTNNTFRRLDND